MPCGPYTNRGEGALRTPLLLGTRGSEFYIPHGRRRSKGHGCWWPETAFCICPRNGQCTPVRSPERLPGGARPSCRVLKAARCPGQRHRGTGHSTRLH